MAGRFLDKDIEEAPMSLLQYHYEEQFEKSKEHRCSHRRDRRCMRNGQRPKNVCGTNCECLRECILLNGVIQYDSTSGYSCNRRGMICFEGNPYGNCGSIRKSSDPTTGLLSFQPIMWFDQPFKSQYYSDTNKYVKNGLCPVLTTCRNNRSEAK